MERNEAQAEADRLVVALAVLHCQSRQIDRRLAELGAVRLSMVDFEDGLCYYDGGWKTRTQGCIFVPPIG